VELVGAEEFGGWDLAVGGGVDLGVGVEEFEGFEEEGEVLSADAVGFGEDEGGGELDLLSEKVFGGAGAGVFVMDEAFEKAAASGVVFDEGFGVDEGDEGVDVVGRMAGDFFDEGPGVGGAGGFDDEVVEIGAMLPGLQCGGEGAALIAADGAGVDADEGGVFFGDVLAGADEVAIDFEFGHVVDDDGEAEFFLIAQEAAEEGGFAGAEEA